MCASYMSDEEHTFRWGYWSLELLLPAWPPTRGRTVGPPSQASARSLTTERNNWKTSGESISDMETCNKHSSLLGVQKKLSSRKDVKKNKLSWLGFYFVKSFWHVSSSCRNRTQGAWKRCGFPREFKHCWTISRTLHTLTAWALLRDRVCRMLQRREQNIDFTGPFPKERV